MCSSMSQDQIPHLQPLQYCWVILVFSCDYSEALALAVQAVIFVPLAHLCFSKS